MALALIGGILTWINRRGGCTRRTKRNNNGFSQEDYTIDMTQNDFNHPGTGAGAAAGIAGVAAVAGAGTATTAVSNNEPLSPFDHSRRFAPAQPVYGENYPDYHEGYSQAGYSQGGYSQEGYSADGGAYPQQGQADYGYYDTAYQQQQSQAGYDNVQPVYDNNNVQPGYDNVRHDYYEQPNHYADVTSPASAGNLSEMAYASSDKPNVKDYNSKPNEL